MPSLKSLDLSFNQLALTEDEILLSQCLSSTHLHHIQSVTHGHASQPDGDGNWIHGVWHGGRLPLNLMGLGDGSCDGLVQLNVCDNPIVSGSEEWLRAPHHNIRRWVDDSILSHLSRLRKLNGSLVGDVRKWVAAIQHKVSPSYHYEHRRSP